MRSKLLLITSVALLAGAAVSGCGHHDKSDVDSGAGEDPVINGQTITLTPAAVTAGGIATGPVKPAAAATLNLPGRLVWDEDRTVRVSSPFSGRVVSIEVKPGDPVKAGQTLAFLSSADYGSAQADARKAQAGLSLAQKAAERARDLFEHGVIAAKDAEQATADLASAQAEAQRAESRLKLFGDRASGVDQRYRLSSPIDGFVVEKNLNPGQEVSADTGGAPLFVITDPTHLWVQLDEPEAGLAAVTPGLVLELASPVYPGEHFKAELTQVGDYVDPTTRTLKLRGRLDNPDRRLKAEMFVSAQLTLPNTGPAALSVPATAVFLVGDQQQIFVAESANKFTRRTIKTGALRDASVTVLEGLQPDEQVVTSGNLFLQQLLQRASKASS